MHEFARQIVEEYEPTQLINLHALAEKDSPLWVLDAIGKFRQWAGIPGASNTKRPSAVTLQELFGRGKAALVALYRAFESGVPQPEAIVVLRALAAITRIAKVEGVIEFDLDNVRPGDGDKRLLVSFDPTLDERLRAAAKVEGQSMSDFVRAAVSDRIATIERRRPRTSGTTAAVSA
jgi:Ribbon-helix-helix protein, copG family